LAATASACDDGSTVAPPPSTGGSAGTAGGGAAEGGSGGSGAVGGGGSGGGGAVGGGGSGGGGEIDYNIETCTGAPTADPGDDVCAVVPGDDRLFIVGDVLTPGQVYEQGGVLIEDESVAGEQMGVIQCVGCDCVDEAEGATQIICPDAAISAGLINAHDHIGWMNGRPFVAAQQGIDPALRWEHRHDWRRGLRGNPGIDVDGGGASGDEKIFGELRFALSGATAIFGSGTTGGLLRDLDDTGGGENGLGQPGAEYQTFPLGDSGGTLLEENCDGYDPKPPPPPSCDCYAPHVAEGIDEAARNELHCLTGCGSGSVEPLDEDSAIIHGIGFNAQEVGYLAAVGIDLIWSPRTNISLYGNTAPVTLYDRLGVNIGLGTDWLPSGSMNMLRELACAASFNETHLGGYFSDHRLWQMATIGSACALAFDDVVGIGSLAPDNAADVAIYANDGRQHYSAVVTRSSRTSRWCCWAAAC